MEQSDDLHEDSYRSSGAPTSPWYWPGSPPYEPSSPLQSPYYSYSPTSPSQTFGYRPSSPIFDRRDCMVLSLRNELQEARDQLLLKQDMLHVKEVQRTQYERQCHTLIDETEHWKAQCLQTKQDYTDLQGLAAFQHRKIQSQSIAFINLQKRTQALVDSTADMTVQLVLFKCYLDTADKHEKALKVQLDQRERAVMRAQVGQRSLQRQLTSNKEENATLHAAMRAASGPLLQTYALNPGTPVNPPPPFAAASRLTMGQAQPAETCDQPPVVCPQVSKPYFMAELEAGSGVYFKAYITTETQVEVELRFPACRETNAAEVLLWVSKFSSRIWRGPLSHDAWTKLANGEGAWRPRKKKQASTDRASKDTVPSHDTDVGEMGRKRLSADMLQTSPAEHSFIDKRRRHGTGSAQILQGAMTLSSFSRDGELARVLQDDGTPAARAKARAQVTLGYKCSAN